MWLASFGSMEKTGEHERTRHRALFCREESTTSLTIRCFYRRGKVTGDGPAAPKGGSPAGPCTNRPPPFRETPAGLGTGTVASVHRRSVEGIATLAPASVEFRADRAGARRAAMRSRYLGMKLFLCQYIVHRSPRYFVDPDEFRPERFSGEASSDRPRFSYFPFGGGPHACLARPLRSLKVSWSWRRSDSDSGSSRSRATR